jgi:hypothetical protein
MILFAAGNDGSSGPGSLTVQSNGKNNLAIGSSESSLGSPNISYIAFYSSQGPTFDNRLFYF